MLNLGIILVFFILSWVLFVFWSRNSDRKINERHRSPDAIILRYEKGKPVYGKAGNTDRLFTKNDCKYPGKYGPALYPPVK